MKTVRLTMAQALVRYLAAQYVEAADGSREQLFGGVWAIFGHGNVAGLGEALYAMRDKLPTFRAHNEQGMALAATAYAKAHFRRRMMAISTSIGPGCTNLVTAAATAHVNRLPLLLLPGDIFITRAPDPVLQQVEDFHDGGVSAVDSLRPVSRYFDRIVVPEQLLTALPRAIAYLTDPALCGPVTLALPQDVQAMAFDWPESFFDERTVRFRQPPAEAAEVAALAAILKTAKRPMIVSGGGVLYSKGGVDALRSFAERHGIPVGESQGGKGALAWDHPLLAGSVGVTGTPAANAIAQDADVVLAVGTRLQDFTTGSHALYAQARLLSINVNTFDAIKWGGTSIQADASAGLAALSAALGDWRADAGWEAQTRKLCDGWRRQLAEIVVSSRAALPTYAEAIGAVQASAANSADNDIVVCAAGTLPAELHKLWRTSRPGGYHMEYGYSCMGYEVAGGLGAKMAQPDREVIVMVGDGSYMMLNNELATSVMLGQKIIVVLLDNAGYACINRLQQACGGAQFNNMYEHCLTGPDGAPAIDFELNARSLGAEAETVRSVAELEAAMRRARASKKSYLISLQVDGPQCTPEGGSWWQVGIPEVSERSEVRDARARYEDAVRRQRY
ncbi:3D-(3,5/4)-trihydroxycyclohexane-1,2-dione acylhydrolase (decyclizing) [Vogesella sp. LIG4]|uniref:3D-(3,5/4)-trihydroxycyclohexane-1,2-dione acylhydrolase (decyclizing) n=1 Tax=Vogesella sp. LIG4 TaxID=1192162 RepID=UPI00081F8A4C|nr:3D-(3,5/4)-trihydroxycyclohexane-1,2-dione acylhydrolase (decyclizing) [Vogesella sp. LIG4]SCK22863.1 3D-(3,5/4)-trihydroxycyclohexane-1,2-dione hydrolase [Vogesella sp. LIG4]